MTWVNLLPWRQQLKRQYQMRWLRSVTPLPLTAMLMLAGFFSVAQHSNLLQQQNQLWQRENQVIQQQIARQRRQMQTVQDKQRRLAELNSHQRQLRRWRQFFIWLDGALPPALWLNGFEGDNHQLQLRGRCAQTDDAASFIASLRQMTVMTNVIPGELRREADGLLTFTLRAEWQQEKPDE